jgi:hypothetical protein
MNKLVHRHFRLPHSGEKPMHQQHQARLATHRAQEISRRRRWILLLVSLLCALGAIALRCYPPVREFVTGLIGAENRGLLEHSLAGVAVPLSLLSFLLLASSDVPPTAAPRWHSLPGMKWLIAFANLMVRYAFLVWSVVYVVLCVCFEITQAEQSVYGGPARGYLQYSQLLADGIGAAIAGVLAWRAGRQD